jgi:hypothetical protein
MPLEQISREELLRRSTNIDIMPTTADVFDISPPRNAQRIKILLRDDDKLWVFNGSSQKV